MGVKIEPLNGPDHSEVLVVLCKQLVQAEPSEKAVEWAKPPRTTTVYAFLSERAS